MRKSKGFTLIELLAVIVILAIIALIAVPVILNVIEKSKIGAAEQSAQGYIDAVEKQIMTNKVKNENLIEEGEYTKAQLDEKNVKIKGEITNAVVVVGEKGRVTQGRFCINGYSIDYDGKKTTKNSEADYCNEMGSILNTCPYEINQVFNFDYTGNVQTFNAECEGNYKLEVWGAQGGGHTSYPGGKGGYSVGKLNVSSALQLFVYVGEAGNYNTTHSMQNGGWNGGGNGYSDSSGLSTHHVASAGGGATDISTIGGECTLTNYRYIRTSDSYLSRIIVAGGGGGSNYGKSTYVGGAGGGTNGIVNGTGNTGSNGGGGGATQTSVGAYSDWCSYRNSQGGFGYGSGSLEDVYEGGGGGWYGGGAGVAGGGGGSGYVYTESTAASCPSGCKLNSTYYLTDASTIAGNQTFKAPNGTDETGHTGNGYARITYLGK